MYAFAHAIDRLIDDGTDVSGSTINTALAGINSVGTGFIGATGNAVFFDGDGNGPADYDVVNLVRNAVCARGCCGGGICYFPPRVDLFGLFPRLAQRTHVHINN